MWPALTLCILLNYNLILRVWNKSESGPAANRNNNVKLNVPMLRWWVPVLLHFGVPRCTVLMNVSYRKLPCSMLYAFEFILSTWIDERQVIALDGIIDEVTLRIRLLFIMTWYMIMTMLLCSNRLQFIWLHGTWEWPCQPLSMCVRYIVSPGRTCFVCLLYILQ